LAWLVCCRCVRPGDGRLFHISGETQYIREVTKGTSSVPSREEMAVVLEADPAEPMVARLREQVVQGARGLFVGQTFGADIGDTARV